MAGVLSRVCDDVLHPGVDCLFSGVFLFLFLSINVSRFFSVHSMLKRI